MTLIPENNKIIRRPKFFLVFFLTIFFLSLGADAAFAQLCYQLPTIRRAPTETKMIGDVTLDYFDGPRENVQLTYENSLVNRRTKSTCHKLKLQISFFNYGAQPKIPESVGLTFWSISNRPKYAAAASRQFKILAGESEIYSDELDRDFSEYKKNQSYSEVLGTEFPFSTLEKMSKAEKVKFVLGKLIIELTAKDLQAIKQLVNSANA